MNCSHRFMACGNHGIYFKSILKYYLDTLQLIKIRFVCCTPCDYAVQESGDSTSVQYTVLVWLRLNIYLIAAWRRKRVFIILIPMNYFGTARLRSPFYFRSLDPTYTTEWRLRLRWNLIFQNRRVCGGGRWPSNP